MKLSVKNIEGKKIREIDADDAVFGIEPNQAVLHQAFVAQRANQRRGTASTKTRGQVQGSTRKTRPQKYTGRARQGSIRAPHRKGGGVVFGPHPRDFSQRLPKRMKRLAIRSAISGKVADGQLVVVEELKLDAPRTKEMKRILTNLGVERSALIVTDEPDLAVKMSARNLTKAKTLPAAYLNVVDMLNHRDLVMTVSAVTKAETLWGGPRTNQRRPLSVAAEALPISPPSAEAAPRKVSPSARRAPVKKAPAKKTTPAKRAPAKKAPAKKAPAKEAPAKTAPATRLKKKAEE